MLQEPRRVPPSADGGRGSNRVFRRRVRRKTHFPGTSVRAKASARRGLHPLEKMLAFLRSVSKFFDTLTRPPANCRRPLVISLPYFRLKNASLPRYCATSPSSSQSPLYSGRPSMGIRHTAPLLLLSPPNPLRWASAGTPIRVFYRTPPGACLPVWCGGGRAAASYCPAALALPG